MALFHLHSIIIFSLQSSVDTTVVAASVWLAWSVKEKKISTVPTMRCKTCSYIKSVATWPNLLPLCHWPLSDSRLDFKKG